VRNEPLILLPFAHAPPNRGALHAVPRPGGDGIRGMLPDADAAPLAGALFERHIRRTLGRLLRLRERGAGAVGTHLAFRPTPN